MFVPLELVKPPTPAVATAEAEAAAAGRDKGVDDKGESIKDLRIIAFGFEETDDGKSAIVEFVARDRAALAVIEKSNRSDVKVFRRTNQNKNEVAAELKKAKKTFQIDRFEVRVQ